MRELPPLSPRLLAAAEMVRPGARAADIGTDHGYLAVWLTLSGRCPSCLACDLRPGPLARAAQTVRSYGAEALVPLRLSDGLDAVSPGETDDIVVAGMGGELIAALVTRCRWLRDPGKRLVLQPMTSQPELRRALARNGFSIQKEAAAREGKKYYVILSAAYTGEVREPDELFARTGLLPRNGDAVSREYLARLAEKLRVRAAGMERSGRLAREAAENRALAAQIDALAAGAPGKDETT